MKTQKGKTIRILYDDQNRLLTKPYSREHLFEMAAKLKIKKCWLEKGYFLIPHFREAEIKKAGKEVKSKIIDAILDPNITT